MFEETGMFKMLTSVENVYGRLDEYITFVSEFLLPCFEKV